MREYDQEERRRERDTDRLLAIVSSLDAIYSSHYDNHEYETRTPYVWIVLTAVPSDPDLNSLTLAA